MSFSSNYLNGRRHVCTIVDPKQVNSPGAFPLVIFPGDLLPVHVTCREGLVGLVLGLVYSLDPGVNRRVTGLEKSSHFIRSRRLSRSGGDHRGNYWEKAPGRSPEGNYRRKSPGGVHLDPAPNPTRP